MIKKYMVTTTGDRHIIEAFGVESAIHNHYRDRKGNDNDEITGVVLYEEPQPLSMEDTENRAEEMYPIKSKKEYNQILTDPYIPYHEYADRIDIQQQAYIAGATSMLPSSAESFTRENKIV